MKTDRSLLDFVADDLRDVQSGIGARDRVRLDQYLDHVREIERRIQHAEQQAESLLAVPNAPVGVPESFEEHVTLLFDLLAVAYQADLTRVFTFMLGRELSQRTYPHIGVTEPHHSISHHGNRPPAIEAHAKVNTYHLTLFAKFIERLRSTPDGDGSLLDQSLDSVRQRHGQRERPLGGSAADAARGRRRGIGEGRQAHRRRRADTERRSPHQHGRGVRRRARTVRRQHGPYSSLVSARI